jgi:hypothetical protein
VPANTAPATLPVKLRAVGDTATASAPWNLVVGGPRLQADLQEVVPLAEGATFRFAVRNVGTDAAFNVTLRLFDGDREVDRMLVREILPGLSASFPLAGRAGPGLYAVLSSDVDPVGTTLHIDGLASPASHGTPLPFVVLPALALAAMARRRRA